MAFPRPRIVAFIPVRGGSKSIPRKNVRLLCGRPLLHWSIDAAAGCEMIQEIYVCTDDPEISRVAQAHGSIKIKVVGRSAETATDTASSESAMLEFAAAHEFDWMVMIQATSPLLTAKDLTDALRKREALDADSMLSVVSQKRFLWEEKADGTGQALNYDPTQRPRRQDFAGQLVENGAFYICERQGLLRARCRLFGKIVLHLMPEESYNELDEPVDWLIVEQLLQVRVKTIDSGCNPH